MSLTASIVLLLPVAPLATACRSRARAGRVAAALAVTVAVLLFAPFATSPTACNSAGDAGAGMVMVLPLVLLKSTSSTASSAVTVLLLPVAPLATAKMPLMWLLRLFGWT